jgi:hypothetical protein
MSRRPAKNRKRAGTCPENPPAWSDESGSGRESGREIAYLRALRERKRVPEGR